MTEDLKAAVEYCTNQLFKDRILGRLVIVQAKSLETLLTHATRHSGNVDAVMDEKKRKRCSACKGAGEYTGPFSGLTLPCEACSPKAALKQPDKTVEVLKGVREAFKLFYRDPGGHDQQCQDYIVSLDWKEMEYLKKQLTALSGVIDGGE